MSATTQDRRATIRSLIASRQVATQEDLRGLLAERGHAAVAVQCLAERARGEFNLGQSEPWSFCDEPADPPCRRPLVPLRVVAVEQDKL